MRWRAWLFAVLLLPAFLLPALLAGDAATQRPDKQFKISWAKTVVDKAFRSEGVAVADVNKDGRPDIIVGDLWYEAPDWTPHPIRKDPRDNKPEPRPYNPNLYSECFGCFAGDFNGDGWPDVIVMPHPGKVCYWYENPKEQPGLWKEHVVWHSACNETPLYADLFANGKHVLIMGVQPKGKEHEGEMCWFAPGKDPTQPWVKHSISGPSRPGKEIPGTFKYSHGLGVGDVNGDGRPDVICTQGWWEQPARDDGWPWKFHPVNLGPDCADMHTYDINGDGLPDIISSSAHRTGLWWHEQRRGKQGESLFLRHDLLPTPTQAAKLPKKHNLTREEVAVANALNKIRASQKRAPWQIDLKLCADARKAARAGVDPKEKETKGSYVAYKLNASGTCDPAKLAQHIYGIAEANLKDRPWTAPNLALGVGIARLPGGKNCRCEIILGDLDRFALFSQSHALHVVDINGDGLKDLVTGRRFWAHGPNGDDTPADPAYVYWFEARRNKNGEVRFIPHLIDDDSGIGTQFTVADINGDGLLDVIVSNKKGVFVFEQVRTKRE